MKQLGKPTTTARGFSLVEFTDLYDVPCSLQASRLTGKGKPGSAAVWLGTDDAQPKILAREAKSVGVETTETNGLVPYPLPANVQLSTRAYLGREQVKALIVHLQNWLEKGEF